MTQLNISKKTQTLALATTGMASAVALMAGAQDVQAEGMYAGISFGDFSGDSPNETASSNEDNYELDGGAFGIFVGTDFISIGNGVTLGGELAISGNVEGDPNDEVGNGEDDYDINWVADAKLRLGTDIGRATVYGFAGATLGTANTGYESYSFQGTNFGLGVETMVGDNMFVGLEVIQRNISSYDTNSDTKHRAVSLRAGFNF
jgi:outer membrane immunogenic protein